MNGFDQSRGGRPIPAPVALWGGIECTVNRIGDTYQDQLHRNGHHHRVGDLEAVAALGLQTLRYPLIWERCAPDQPDQLDWRWSDERLAELRRLRIQPIVGLIHHGCGPRYATFDQPAFEHELPRFARAVAERYPWVNAYTPVNEPLTTARFAGLYGHWYPHTTHDRMFADILLRQCRATARAMREIRAVNPDAQLIQTDDLGYIHGSPLLRYQTDFENSRRWVTWDLLSGQVQPGHPMWEYFRYVGVPEADLWAFAENPCPPSVIGVNHYLTSERYLDADVHRYPPHRYSHNGRHTYVDTEIVRAAPEQRIGLAGLLMQAWERYRLPLAVTEVHLGCTVDEQLRYLWDFWCEANAARQQGADVRAITTWALFGSYDWNSLLTRCDNYYEPGAFDVRDGTLRPTELAGLIRALAKGQPAEHLVPSGLGWWQVSREVALNS